MNIVYVAVHYYVTEYIVAEHSVTEYSMAISIFLIFIILFTANQFIMAKHDRLFVDVKGWRNASTHGVRKRSVPQRFKDPAFITNLRGFKSVKKSFAVKKGMSVKKVFRFS